MTQAGEAALIWCPFPDESSAAAAANTLLDESLVACVNVLPAMRSIFAWRGQRDETRETGAILKTNVALLEKAIARLAQLHPYEEPAIVGWRCDRASAATGDWLGSLAP